MKTAAQLWTLLLLVCAAFGFKNPRCKPAKLTNKSEYSCPNYTSGYNYVAEFKDCLPASMVGCGNYPKNFIQFKTEKECKAICMK